MRLFKYLARHKGAVALVFMLLVGQAYCDLMLPNYTASIVDVGIQQSGIDHVSPDRMGADTFRAVSVMVSEEDEQLVRASYRQAPNGTYELAPEAAGDRETLDGIMAFPLVVANALQQGILEGTDGAAEGEDEDDVEGAGEGAGEGALPGSAQSASPMLDMGAVAESPQLAGALQSLTLEQRMFLVQAARDGDLSLSTLLDAVDRGVFSHEQVADVVRAARSAIDVSDDLVQQQGIAATRAEYERIGVDTGALQLNYLLATAAKMMGFVALSVLIASLVGLVASRTGAKIGRELRGRMFAKVMSFSDAEVQRFSTASLITRGTNDIQLIQMMCIMLLRMVLYAPILAVGGVIMISRTDLSMGWIIAVAVALLLVVVFVLMAVAMPKFRIMQKLVDRVNLVSREMLTGVSVVRAFGQQDREQRRFDAASMDLMSTQLFTNRVMTFMMPMMMLVMNGISVVIVWVGAQAIDAGSIQTGDLIAFITYSMVIIMGFLMLGMLAVIAPRADVSAQRIDEVLETELSIADPAADVSAQALARLQEASAAAPGAVIAFDHVDFRYDDDSESVLRDVSFTAEAGSTCAVIGPTGSGKSTIVKLIERFYDVSSGKVTIDGVDVRDIPQEALRAQLGYVPQKAFLFSGTVGSNVGYGEVASESRVAEAVEIAQAADFVQSNEDGFDAEITQGGTNVSGGQRQRLAIARALATDARAFLFDDSFSALDYKTDAALRQALASRMKGRTQIIVAQRIATVLHADKIIVLDEGRVVGQGTHAQLMESCDQYREIAYSQLAPEELEGLSGGSAAYSAAAEGGDPR